MADVIIRGMKIPKDCPMCKLAHFNKFDEFTGCDSVPGKRYVPHSDYQFWNSAERPEWCPLVPLPEGHGRLGDLDALDRAFTDLRFNSDGTLNHWGDRPGWCMHGYEVEKLIADAPTIVPAEGGTENG